MDADSPISRRNHPNTERNVDIHSVTCVSSEDFTQRCGKLPRFARNNKKNNPFLYYFVMLSVNTFR